jgi:hypothetical protein
VPAASHVGYAVVFQKRKRKREKRGLDPSPESYTRISLLGKEEGYYLK